MKYFAPPILAVLLMGWPTVASFLYILKGDSGGAAAGGAASLESKVKAAAEELKNAQEARTVLDALCTATGKPYGAGPSPKLSGKTAIQPPWEGYAKLKDELSRLLQAMSGFPDPSYQAVKGKKPDAIQSQIDGVRKTSDALQASFVKEFAEGYVQRLSDAKDQIVNAGFNDDLFATANKQMLGKDVAGVIRTLDTWKGDPSPEAKQLRARAQFQVQAGPLYERVAIVNPSSNAKDWEDLVRVLKPLVDAGLPPLAADAEKQLYERLERALKSFEARIQLSRIPLRPLGPWAQSARQLISSGGDKYAQASSRTRLRTLIDAELPLEKRSADEPYREAIDLGGRRILGTFQEMGQATWYNFWLPGVNAKASPPSNIWLRNNLKQQPQLPLAVRCINDYKAARSKLSSQLGDRNAWQAFQAACEGLAAELRDLQKDVSFDKEISFVKEVLDSWDDLQGFLSP